MTPLLAATASEQAELVVFVVLASAGIWLQGRRRK